MKNCRRWKHKKQWKTAAWSGICVTWGVLGPLVISSETTDHTLARKEKGPHDDDGVAAASDADSIDLEVSSSSSLPEIVDSRRLTLALSDSKADWLNSPGLEKSLLPQLSSTDATSSTSVGARQNIFLDNTAAKLRRADLEAPISQINVDPSQDETLLEESALSKVALEEPTSKEPALEVLSLEETDRVISLEPQPEIMPASASSDFQSASRQDPLNASTSISSRFGLPVFSPSRASVPPSASEPLSVEAEANGLFSEEEPSHTAANPLSTVDNMEDSPSVEPTMGNSVRLAASNDVISSISYEESASWNAANPAVNPSGLLTAADLMEEDSSRALALDAAGFQEAAEPLLRVEALDDFPTAARILNEDSHLTPSDTGADTPPTNTPATSNTSATEPSLVVENREDSTFNTDSICFKQLPSQHSSATLATRLTTLRTSLRFDTPRLHRVPLEESLPTLAPGYGPLSQRMLSEKACTISKRLRRMRISHELESAALNKS